MAYTYKQRFNKKYKQKLNQPNSLEDISRLTGYKLSGLKKIFEKGEGAFYTNPSSVRPNVTNAQQWGYARTYSAVMGGKASKIDKDLLIKK
jgi:hypothetical protein